MDGEEKRCVARAVVWTLVAAQSQRRTGSYEQKKRTNTSLNPRKLSILGVFDGEGCCDCLMSPENVCEYWTTWYLNGMQLYCNFPRTSTQQETNRTKEKVSKYLGGCFSDFPPKPILWQRSDQIGTQKPKTADNTFHSFQYGVPSMPERGQRTNKRGQHFVVFWHSIWA